MNCRCAVTLVALWLASAASAEDLAKRYPATLDSSEPPVGREWTCEASDVWSLSSFVFAVGKDLEISLGPSNAAFGKCGTDVVWAVVVPDKPAPLATKLDGNGEKLTSLWMRFHPALAAELFPTKSVKKIGPEDLLVLARRVAQWKMSSCWQSDNRPVVPWRRSITIDAETASSTRRFYSIDTDAKTVKYEKYFVNRGLPPLAPIDSKLSVENFDATWKAFDAEYAMFAIKPGVDWAKLQKAYRPKAAKAKTTYECGAAIAQLLAHLEDLHVFVKVGDEFVPCFDRPRPLNGSFQAAATTVANLQDTKKQISWGRTDDGIGYINVYGLENPELPDVFDQALEKLGDTWSLVLDLRFNGGGDETLARRIAGRFLDQKRMYSVNQYRSGPAHDALGPRLPREFEPRGPWRYQAPVVTLIGQRTMSSAESFALMMAQCPQATTMGDRTAGSSANPRQLELPGKIVVNLPRWLDMDPAGKPIDAVGIAPSVAIAAESAAFTATTDPVLDAALARLREQPASDRKPGRAAN